MADIKEHTLAKAYIEDGMIVKFTYKKVNGQEREYTVIVVDKNHNGKLHGLNAQEVSPSSLAGLGLVTSKRMKEARGLDIPIVQNMDQAGTDGYRTFIFGNIQRCVVLEWPFPAQQVQAAEELEIPKKAIEGMKTIEVAQAGDPVDETIEQEVRGTPDDVIVQKIKRKFQEKFGEEKRDEN